MIAPLSIFIRLSSTHELCLAFNIYLFSATWELFRVFFSFFVKSDVVAQIVSSNVLQTIPFNRHFSVLNMNKEQVL